MPRKSKGLSHREIWDDTTLMDNWNDALAEYKKYHSIAAQGQEAVNKFLAEHKVTEEVRKEKQVNGVATQPEAEPDEEIEAGEVDDNAVVDLFADNYEDPGLDPRVEVATTLNEPITAGQAALGHVATSVQDESLKNLMMSWYYAGYYTGLHEGRRNPHPPPS